MCAERSLLALGVSDFSQRSGEVGSRKIRAEKKPQSGRRLTERGKAPRKEKRAYHQELIAGCWRGG